MVKIVVTGEIALALNVLPKPFIFTIQALSWAPNSKTIESVLCHRERRAMKDKRAMVASHHQNHESESKETQDDSIVVS